MKRPRTFKGLMFLLLGTVGIGLAGLGLVGFAHPAHAQLHGNANFWFLNDTGAQIDQIFVSAHSQTSWGDDVLGDKAVLGDGIGVLITFPSTHTQCSLDFKLVFHDGSTQTYADGFNTCNLHAVIFKDGEATGY
jgi:hypothetical protein